MTKSPYLESHYCSDNIFSTWSIFGRYNSIFAIICLPICFGDSKAPMIWYSFSHCFLVQKYCSYSYITLSRSFRGRFSNSCSNAFKNVILSKLSTAIQIVRFHRFLFQFKTWQTDKACHYQI